MIKENDNMFTSAVAFDLNDRVTAEYTSASYIIHFIIISDKHDFPKKKNEHSSTWEFFSEIFWRKSQQDTARGSRFDRFFSSCVCEYERIN